MSQCVRVAKEVSEIWNSAMLRGARAGTGPAAAKVGAVHKPAARVTMCGISLLHLG